MSSWSNWRWRLSVVAMLVCLPGIVWVGSAQAQFGDPGGGSEPILTVRTYISHDSVTHGDSIWLAVRLDLLPDWHVNSAHPLQDFLIPTVLTIDAPRQYRVGAIVYPKGSVIPLLGESMSVYESGATILVPLVVAGDAPLRTSTITGSVHYQGCDSNSCIAPDEAEVSWEVTVASAPGTALHATVFASVSSGGSDGEAAEPLAVLAKELTVRGKGQKIRIRLGATRVGQAQSESKAVAIAP